jgi:glycosyltransferase involved in cell wall biosynthesis
MRVLVPAIVNRKWMGGVSTYLRNLETSLLEFGVEIRVVDEGMGEQKNARALLEKTFKHLLDVYSGGRYGCLMIMQSAGLLCQVSEDKIHEYDLVHAQDPFVALVIRKMHPEAIIVLTIHGLVREHMLENFTIRRGCRPLAKRATRYNSLVLKRLCFYEREGISSADHLLSVDSNYALKTVRMGIPASKISVIHNAVDVSLLQTLSERTSMYHLNRPYFLMLRRLAPKNGVQFGVRAFLSWVGNRDIQLVLAGDGPLREQIKSECLCHRSGKKIIFLGEVSPDAIPVLIKKSIATLVPSVPVGDVVEATSLAALESLALGVPVIASDIGGLSEIDGGKKVLNLVPPASVEHIVLELEKVYNDYQNGMIDRQTKQKHVIQNFNIKSWARKVLDVYQKAILKKAPFPSPLNPQKVEGLKEAYMKNIPCVLPR